MSETTHNKPFHVLRQRGIKVSFSEYQLGSPEFDNTIIRIEIQAVGGKWKTTTYFGGDDLPILQFLLERASERILDVERAVAQHTARGQAAQSRLQSESNHTSYSNSLPRACTEGINRTESWSVCEGTSVSRRINQ